MEKQSHCLIEIKNQKYPKIFEKYNLRITQDRLEDFRSTMREIIEIKNGEKEPDGRGT